MALNSDWVDAIFARLALAYGQRFMAQWSGLQPDHVKAAWADALDGVTSRGVRHAYDHLDPDYPPNALQFRKLCREAYVPERPALPAPPGQCAPADRARLQRAMAPLAAPKDPKAWALKLKAREEAGEHLSIAQREMWRSCIRTGVHRASADEAGDDAVTRAVAGAET